MARIKYDDYYSYEIFEDGYLIFKCDSLILEQKDPYGHVFIPDGTYEENAIAQLDGITAPQPPAPEPEPTDEEILRADVDYMALMLDVDLPSYEKEG